jgi:hypothetical protein
MISWSNFITNMPFLRRKLTLKNERQYCSHPVYVKSRYVYLSAYINFHSVYSANVPKQILFRNETIFFIALIGTQLHKTVCMCATGP